MIKQLLTGAAAAVLVSGAAFAQVSMPPGPLPTGDSDTNIKAGIAPDGSFHAKTTTKSVDDNGQQLKVNHSYESGPDGTRESHTQTQTDPDTGTNVTRSTTTTQQH